MGLVSIEEAVLGFVQKVKNDPGLSDLFREELHELEHLLNPQPVETTPPGPVPSDPPPPVTEPPVAPLDDQSGFAGQFDTLPPVEPAVDTSGTTTEPTPGG